MRYFDAEQGLLDRKAFASADVFAQEVRRIFASEWIFASPAAWVAAPGRFVTTRLGPEPVILWRAPSGRVHLIVNACPFGLAPLEDRERGDAAHFVCSCHGATFGEADAERRLRAGRVEEFRGLLFATSGATAPVVKSLGDFGFYMEGLTAIRFLDDAAVPWRIACDWKLAVEDACIPVEHTTGTADGFQTATSTGAATFVHADTDRIGRRTTSPMPSAAVLFPNLTFDPQAAALHVWHPIAPDETEVHSYCTVPSDAAPEQESAARRAFMLAFDDDARRRRRDSWTAITRSARGTTAARATLNLQAGLGRERRTNMPGIVGPVGGDTNARAFYRWWQDRIDPVPGADRVAIARAAA